MTDTLTYEAYAVTSLTSKLKVNNIKFGDGYSQRQPASINSNMQRWSLSLPNRSGQEIGDMEDFFEAQIGVYFLWTPPGDTERRFRCLSWTRVFNHSVKVQSLRVVIEEAHE